MEFLFEVTAQDTGVKIVTGSAESGHSAWIAAKALKVAFPDAVVQYRVPNTAANGDGAYRWILGATQSLDDLLPGDPRKQTTVTPLPKLPPLTGNYSFEE